MSRFHDSVSVGALVLALGSAPAMAATSVSTETTTPLVTSSAGDVTVTEDGSIVLTKGSAITVDSNDAVDLEGELDLDDADGADGASGITVAAGTSADIYTGEDADISVLEDFVPEDEDSNSIADGEIASASNRYGIYVAGDAAGSITNEGSIDVEGLDSGGIVLAGDYTGDIYNTGSITVVGDNALGISTQGVDGNLTVEGDVTVTGAGATALSVAGDVTGVVTVQGALAQSYYFTNDDADTISLSRAALREGAATVSITGNVDGGIIIAAPPVDNDDDDDDEDNDGVDDDEEGTGSVVAYGNGAAIQIGGSQDITIGAGTGHAGDYSLIVDGSVVANSRYSNTDAFGVVIGSDAGRVTLSDGIGVTGSIRATTYDSDATALLIKAGSTVETLYNSGTISAIISSPGEGTTTAIRDLSGTLTSIENTGYILANGSSTDVRTAIDLSANTTGVTITQYLNDADAETSAEYLEDNEVDVDPTVYTRIYGDIALGSGDDTIDASSGTIIGDTTFGDGDDTLSLSGDLAYTGDVYFEGGTGTATMADTSSFDGTMDFAGNAGTLTISDSATYTGTFANADNLTVTVNGGSLIAGEDETASFGTLYVGSEGAVGIAIDGDEVSTIDVASATFADGAGITATISDLASAEGTYSVLTADSLTLEGSLETALDLPFIYDGTVSSEDNAISLTISRKSTDDLGIDRSSAAAWEAIYATAANDDYLAESLLQVEDTATLQEQTSGLLPDYAGGVFEAVTQGTRLVSQHVSDDTSTFDITDAGGWLEPVYWRASKDATGSAGYDISGWGLSAGIERRTRIGYVGFSYAWLQGSVEDTSGSQDLDIGEHALGLFWRNSWGPLMTWARVGAARVSVDSTRTYTGTIDDTDFTYDADGKWSGWLLSGLAGASYRYAVSPRFSLKPKVELEQFWLRENGYTEDADSDAIALTVASRTSKSTTLTPTLTAAYSLGRITPDYRPLTFQFEGGRREVLAGGLGDTTAYFGGGDSYDAGDAFTLTGDDIQGTWIGELSVLAGGYDFTWKISGRMEKTSDSTDFSARAGLSVAF